MNREMKLKILMIIPLISEIVALLFLPSEIPVHYNAAFQVDGYGSKFSLLILGFIIVVFGLFMTWIYKMSMNTLHETIVYQLCVGALFVFNVINLLAIGGSMFFGVDESSIAIIGGADGPTAIFLAGSLGDSIIPLILLGVVVILGIAMMCWKRRKR